MASQTAPPPTTNPIAEQKQRLHKVQTNAPKQPLSNEEQEKLDKSKDKATQSLGKHKSDHPSLIIGLLKYYKSDVEQQRRIFRDFFSQWPKTDLLVLKSILEHQNINSNSTQDQHEPHPFEKHALQWQGLSQSYGTFKDLLEEAIARPDAEEITKEERWNLLVAEYEQAHKET
eukprot:CAMPEP_0168542882 /NCGR_PEP_ID=MMETSP0413-20121227/1581_1 /TAXON_ID=136452 /ORGANISM="Filamoeba nolandi, Strain NC-AS-23-1" /LENGTH=172 /DNA_ID=CAMNT_0008572781 /DNA_START=161 /DNA_END=679 /DNA_ORIENTATION=-